MRTRLSPTAIAIYNDCPQQYKYRDIDRIKPTISQANLPFGTALHDSWEHVIRAHYDGKDIDAAARFSQVFEFELTGCGKTYEFPKAYTRDEMFSMGEALCSDFAFKWPKMGLTPIVDEHGIPMLEKTLIAPIGERVELKAKLDGIFITRDGDVVVADHKTARSACPDGFPEMSDQLTAQQYLVEYHRDALGVSKVAKVGFIEAIKRKVPKGAKGSGPYVEEPHWADARTPEQMVEFAQKLDWMAEDIQRQRFPKTPRMGHNTPCSMCDFRAICQKKPMDSYEGMHAFGSSFAVSKVEGGQQHSTVDLETVYADF